MKKKGFTLIELMVVIAIIAVLAAVIAPQVFRQIAKGRAASVESFHNSVKVAGTSYFSDLGAWPPSCTQLTCNNNPGPAPNGNYVANTAVGNANWDGPYIDRWPSANSNPWGGNFTWVNNAASANFGAAAAGERYITITAVPLADAIRIDTDKDGGTGILGTPTTGIVRNSTGGAWAATNIVWILVSRDGPVT